MKLLVLLLLSSTALAGTDYQCLSTCTRQGYGYAWCTQNCSMDDRQAPSVQYHSPLEGYRKGEQYAQEKRLRELEIERQERELANSEASEVNQELLKFAKDANDHIQRLTAENEMLRQRIEELERKLNSISK